MSLQLPNQVAAYRELLDLRDRVVELSNNRPEQLQAEGPALIAGLHAGGACHWDWQDLLSRCPNFEDLPRLAAVAKNKGIWKIRTGEWRVWDLMECWRSRLKFVLIQVT
jgi:hypothetical protein